MASVIVVVIPGACSGANRRHQPENGCKGGHQPGVAFAAFSGPRGWIGHGRGLHIHAWQPGDEFFGIELQIECVEADEIAGKNNAGETTEVFRLDCVERALWNFCALRNLLQSEVLALSFAAQFVADSVCHCLVPLEYHTTSPCQLV